MNADLLKGKLVRLVMPEPEARAELHARWMRNSEYMRLLDSGTARLYSKKQIRNWFDKDEEKDVLRNIFFYMQTLADDRVIGDIGLDGILWNHGDCFVGISIGDPQDWGKGYGTDAMRIILRYAFTELGLHRVSLDVFEYNPRGIRSYEKAGFKYEGRLRQYLNRDGQRWDMVFMGILKEEWEAVQNS